MLTDRAEVLILGLLTALIIGVVLAVQIPRHVEGLRARQAAGQQLAAGSRTGRTAGEWVSHVAGVMAWMSGLPVWLVVTVAPYLFRHDIVGALEGRGWDGQVATGDPGLGGVSGKVADIAGTLWVLFWIFVLVCALYVTRRRRSNQP